MKKLSSLIISLFIIFLSFTLSPLVSAAGQWQQSGSNWQYISNGQPLTGWHELQWSKGKNWFYFDDDGNLLTNTTTPDGYKVDADGVWDGKPSQSNTSGTNNSPSTNSQGGSDCVQTVFFGEICGDDGIPKILGTVITILTYGIGIAATVGIVISGLEYISARDDQGKIVKAKNRIFNIVLGLVAYAVLWGFLNWLIPGGIRQ